MARLEDKIIDDLKAYYFEAVQSTGTAPASRQIDAGFWRESLAGRLVQALRVVALRNDNNALKTVSGRFFCSGSLRRPTIMKGDTDS